MKKKQHRVVCEFCKHEWPVKDTELLEKVLIIKSDEKEQPFDVSYFQCLKCGKVYIYSVLNQECLGLVNRIEELNDMLVRTKENKVYSDDEKVKRVQWLIKTINSKQSELENKSNIIKTKHSKQFVEMLTM